MSHIVRWFKWVTEDPYRRGAELAIARTIFGCGVLVALIIGASLLWSIGAWSLAVPVVLILAATIGRLVLK